jgi:D-galactarolactone cycloisomerase
MRIATVETFELAYKAPALQGNAFGHVDRRSCVLVRVRTHEGVVGWGETWRHPEVARTFVERLAPRLIGEDPLDRERLLQRFYYDAVGYDRHGAYLAALSAIDIALWDVAGKLLGQPVAKLIGGVFRDRVEAYASGPFLPPPGGDPVAHYLAETERYAQAGLRVIKMRAGFTPELDERLVAAVRNALGPNIRLAVDFNQGYDRLTAVRSLLRLEPYGMAWAEEPVAPDDIDGYLHVRRHIGVPLAGGETESMSFGFVPLLERRVLDIVQPDVSVAGGITECLKIRHLAEAWRVTFTPHVWGSAIGAAASLQLLASAPPYAPTLNAVEPLLEWDRSPNPFRDHLLKEPIRFEGPYAVVPAGPGLGIEVDELVLQTYRVG